MRDLLLILVAFNLVGALAAWPIGAASDRFGRFGLIVAGWLIYAGVYLAFALAGPGAPVGLIWIVYGAYYGIAEAVGKALVADFVGPAQRGTAYGILNGATGLALLPASVVAGLLWDRVGPAAPFWFGAVCAVAAVLLLIGPARRARRHLSETAALPR